MLAIRSEEKIKLSLKELNTVIRRFTNKSTPISLYNYKFPPFSLKEGLKLGEFDL